MEGDRFSVAPKVLAVARQVSPLAELEIECLEERNPAIRDSQIVEATLHLKGATLRACERSTDMIHSLNLVADDDRVEAMGWGKFDMTVAGASTHIQFSSQK